MEYPTKRSWRLALGSNRTAWLLWPGIALLVALVGYQIWRANGAGALASTPGGMPISAEMENKFGVRFTDLRLAGRGGLVDLRYRVVDADKAKNFGHYTETSPLLIAEDGGKVEVTIMGLHNHRVEAGRIYYVLYRNTENVIKPGSLVTIRVGDLQLTNVVAH